MRDLRVACPTSDSESATLVCHVQRSDVFSISDRVGASSRPGSLFGLGHLPPPPSLMPEVVAVACILDSSLTLAQDWPQLFQEYVSPLLTRLHELYSPSRSVSMTYGVLDICI